MHFEEHSEQRDGPPIHLYRQLFLGPRDHLRLLFLSGLAAGLTNRG